MDVADFTRRIPRAPGALGLLLLACALLYGHTLDVPMYLDDISSISDNPALADAADWGRIFAFSEMRFVAYLSFALNQAVHGDHVAGYHLVNLLIHFAVAAVLYFLLRALARTPAMAAGTVERRMPWLALAAALLFLVHPLHTQAVTYIVQRLASLVALFYLLSLLGYVLGRQAAGASRWPWYGLCALAGLLALFTKQNAVTLPAALLLLEFCFFAEDRRAVQRVLVIGAVGLAAAVLLPLLAHLTGLLPLEQLDTLTRETLRISRVDYLAAQTLVLWRYIGLFLWPHPLVLDYGLLPVWSFSDWQVWLAALGHLAVVALGIFLLRRSPLAAFGLLFYYLAHSVESGVIPIKDLMFEHRAYLPDAGLAMVFAALLARLPARVAAVAVPVLLLALSVQTWQRNDLWRNQVAFFNDAIRHAPNQPRNWVYLSKVYHKAGENELALDFLERELRANEERHGRLRTDLATQLYWAKLLRLNGREARAAELEARLAKQPITRVQQMRLLLQQGNAALRAGDYDAAEDAYRGILAMDSTQSSAAVNLGVIAMQRGEYQQAIDIFEQNPDHPVAKANLPKVRAAMAGELQLQGLEEKVIERAQ